MGRRRTKNTDMPPRLYPRKDGFYYRHPNGKEVKVAGPDEKAIAFIRWAEFEGVRLDPDAITFGAVARQFELEYIPLRELKTQRDYSRQLKQLGEAFNASALDTIKPVDVAEYRKLRTAKLMKKKGGKGTQANRELSLLSALWNWAREKGYTQLPNPVTGIKRNKEEGRGVYMTDAVFSAIYLAGAQDIMDCMDVGCATGMDIGVILKARIPECIHGDYDELHLRRTKTKVPVRYRLRAGDGKLNALGEKIKAMVERPRNARGSYLIQDENGQSVPYDTFCDHFDQARTAAGYVPGQYQFRDIRPKVATDEEDIQLSSNRLGHTSTTTTKRHYIRRGRLVEPAE